MKKSQPEKYRESINYAIMLMSHVDDPFHGLEHAKNTVQLAKLLLAREPEADKSIVIISAWWHDVGRIKGDEGHEKRSAQMAEKDLLGRGFDEQFCRQVYLAIAHHRFDMKPTTFEGIIVKDADKLSLLDPVRWQDAVNRPGYHKFEHTIHILKSLRDQILELPAAKALFDENVKRFITFIRQEKSEGFAKERDEILSALVR